MSTLAALRDRLRLTLAEAITWPDDTLDAWIGDAIRFYSGEFPRTVERVVALSAGVRAYDLPTGCLGVAGVEYPAGEEPPRWLAQTDERGHLFAAGGAAYALRAAGAPEGCSAGIVFAETPVAGQSAVVTCLEGRAVPEVGDDDAELDCPDAHLEALIAFCEFRAHWERETICAVTPDAVSLTLAQLGENARRAWNRYREVVARLRWSSGGASAVVWWG